MDKNKFAKIMGEFLAGTLTDSDGKTVTDRKIALSIAASEAGMMPKRKPADDEELNLEDTDEADAAE